MTLSAHNAPEPQHLRDTAIELVTEAAALITRKRAEADTAGSGLKTETKSSEVDPVTEVDKAAEELITRRLKAHRPGDGLVGEEGANSASSTGVEWIIDPIDGTVNFIYGIPSYAVSVGVAVDGELVAGAVRNVATGETYSAARGFGAWLEVSGRTTELRASAADTPAHALIATGFSYSSAWRARQATILSTVLPQVRDIRRAGSAALDLCAVAAGRVDAYYEHGTHPWDWAAGALIAREAGALVQHPPIGARAGSDVVFAAAPGVAEPLRDILGAAGAFNSLDDSDEHTYTG
ncbi:inositol monophosphatase family protein [Corynebacterium mayonis]|uniref:inositol monophosphatase family protein n=1 Tax=Corynebacterium mayonis TaxID=3062461 RepID=UPI0031400E71